MSVHTVVAGRPFRWPDRSYKKKYSLANLPAKTDLLTSRRDGFARRLTGDRHQLQHIA
jgi:hypothetical protein